MINDIKITICYRCTYCGKVEMKEISIFSLSGNKPFYVECDCNKFYFKISKNKKGDYVITYPCILCNEMHRFEIGRKMFWNNTNIAFACPVFEVEMFYSVSYENVSDSCRLIKKEAEDIMEAIGYNTFWGVNPFAPDIIGKIQKLSGHGKLSCKCSSKDIKLMLFYDRIELECVKCGLSMCVDAVVEDDVVEIKSYDEVIIGGCNITE